MSRQSTNSNHGELLKDLQTRLVGDTMAGTSIGSSQSSSGATTTSDSSLDCNLSLQQLLLNLDPIPHRQQLARVSDYNGSERSLQTQTVTPPSAFMTTTATTTTTTTAPAPGPSVFSEVATMDLIQLLQLFIPNGGSVSTPPSTSATVGGSCGGRGSATFLPPAQRLGSVLPSSSQSPRPTVPSPQQQQQDKRLLEMIMASPELRQALSLTVSSSSSSSCDPCPGVVSGGGPRAGIPTASLVACPTSNAATKTARTQQQLSDRKQGILAQSMCTTTTNDNDNNQSSSFGPTAGGVGAGGHGRAAGGIRFPVAASAVTLAPSSSSATTMTTAQEDYVKKLFADADRLLGPLRSCPSAGDAPRSAKSTASATTTAATTDPTRRHRRSAFTARAPGALPPQGVQPAVHSQRLVHHPTGVAAAAVQQQPFPSPMPHQESTKMRMIRTDTGQKGHPMKQDKKEKKRAYQGSTANATNKKKKKASSFPIGEHLRKEARVAYDSSIHPKASRGGGKRQEGEEVARSGYPNKTKREVTSAMTTSQTKAVRFLVGNTQNATTNDPLKTLTVAATLVASKPEEAEKEGGNITPRSSSPSFPAGESVGFPRVSSSKSSGSGSTSGTTNGSSGYHAKLFFRPGSLSRFQDKWDTLEKSVSGYKSIKTKKDKDEFVQELFSRSLRKSL